MKKPKKDYGIDEINVIESYVGFLNDILKDETAEMSDEERKKEKAKIKGLKNWIKELKKTSETYENPEWKIEILTEIYETERDTEVLGDEEGLELHREYVNGIKEWLDDLKNVCDCGL